MGKHFVIYIDETICVCVVYLNFFGLVKEVQVLKFNHGKNVYGALKMLWDKFKFKRIRFVFSDSLVYTINLKMSKKFIDSPEKLISEKIPEIIPEKIEDLLWTVGLTKVEGHEAYFSVNALVSGYSLEIIRFAQEFKINVDIFEKASVVKEKSKKTFDGILRLERMFVCGLVEKNIKKKTFAGKAAAKIKVLVLGIFLVAAIFSSAYLLYFRFNLENFGIRNNSGKSVLVQNGSENNENLAGVVELLETNGYRILKIEETDRGVFDDIEFVFKKGVDKSERDRIIGIFEDRFTVYTTHITVGESEGHDILVIIGD
jgi:hypothetical protein